MDIVITEFSSRKKPNGKIKHTTWEDLVERLKSPVITEETIEDYKKASNEDRTAIKDVGGYVAGEFENGKRDKTLLKSRYILTIDADEATSHDVDDYECCYDYTFFVHTTHTSTEEQPRLRWLFPLSRPVTAEEYRMLIGVAKSWVGADTIDETTDQPERLMFWPSVSLDADYQYWQGGAVIVDPDELLDGIDPEDYEIPVASSDKVSSDTEDFDFGSQITEGSRNISVFKYGSKLREFGFDDDLLLEAIIRYNDEHCVPPLPNRDIKTIAHSICTRYKKGEYIPYDAFTADSDFGDLGKNKKKEKQEKLEAETLAHLMNRDVPPPVYIIDGLIPVGLGAIIAAPKIGKSWFSLDLAMAVSTGTDFLEMHTTQHDVLYLALEDHDYRLKDRSRKINEDGHTSYTDHLFFVKRAPLLSENLLDLLDDFLDEHPDVKLIIIDTLQRVRGLATKKDNAYSYDYTEMGRLQDYAIDKGIALLVVHHTKKGRDMDDFMNNTSGSQGINGSLDVALYINKKNRKDTSAELEVIGRDVIGKTYRIEFDDLKYRWINRGEEGYVQEKEEETAYRKDALVKMIKDKLKEIEDGMTEEDGDEVVWRVTASELFDLLKAYDPQTIFTSAKGLTAHLAEISDRLSRDGIVYDANCRDRSSRYKSFTTYRIY